VFTTVHANNVVDVLGRFSEHGRGALQLCVGVELHSAQRLVRIICDSCRTAVHYPNECWRRADSTSAMVAVFRCMKGRVALSARARDSADEPRSMSFLDLTDRIREMILDRNRHRDPESGPRRGYALPARIGAGQGARGFTTLKEINKVTFIETMR